FASSNPALPDQDLTYEYDAAGNRVRTTVNGTVTPYQTNDLNQYTMVGTASQSFDADGNLIGTSDGTGTSTFTYDDENRLVGVAGAGGTWTYQYDAFGHRTAVMHAGEQTQFLIDPAALGEVVAAYDGLGNLEAHYLHSGATLVGRTDAGGSAAYYDFDGTGSTAGLTDGTGHYVDRYAYRPFGELLQSTESVANPFTFVGQFGVMHETNGLQFMRARYYSTADGRFLQPD